MSLAGWIIAIIFLGIMAWSLWTLAVGAGLIIRRLTGQDLGIPPWVQTVNVKSGISCPECSTELVITVHENDKPGLLCTRCTTYGVIYPEFIEWTIPGKGVEIQTLDPSAPNL